MPVFTKAGMLLKSTTIEQTNFVYEKQIANHAGLTFVVPKKKQFVPLHSHTVPNLSIRSGILVYYTKLSPY